MAAKEVMDQIFEIVKQSQQGASISQISEALSRDSSGTVSRSISRRTLQRYLTHLVKEGRLQAEGKARAVRYRISSEIEISPRLHSVDIVAEEPIAEYKIEKLIPLSTIALSIQENVRKPIQARRPVGYNRDFLINYRPNETYYLSESIRKHLLQKGKPQENHRPAGTYAKQILNRLLIDLSWNSSRLEGNTYSLLETERLLELGEAPEGKNSREAQMILNHKAAIEFLVESADHLRFNTYTILNLHAFLSDNLLSDQRECGSLRSKPVGIAKSVYQPLAIPQLIYDYFQQILDTAEAITDPFEQSFFVMVQMPYLQPFLDVNKRVSRLAANIPFIRQNLCPLSFVDVPEKAYISGLLGVYELNRIEMLREVYVWAYERSCLLYMATKQELGEPDLFRLRYRSLIIFLVGEIIHNRLDKPAAVMAIKQKAS